MQSPKLEIQSNSGATLLQQDLYVFIQQWAAQRLFYWGHLAPFRVLLDGVAIEPAPKAKDDF